MKARYRPSEYLEIEVDGTAEKEIFEQLARCDEVFSDEPCGMCQSGNTKFVCRTVDANKYFERRCGDCGATLAYGQNKTGGGLFPKRKIEEGGKEVYDKKSRGWAKWVPKEGGKK
jgi:hypothetical protein